MYEINRKTRKPAPKKPEEKSTGKILYPTIGRPKTANIDGPHQNNYREYIKINKTFSFTTEKEIEDFENMIQNLKIRTGETRQDKIMMSGLKIMDALSKGKIKIVEL